jgi:hypothetical protein
MIVMKIVRSKSFIVKNVKKRKLKLKRKKKE